MASFFTNKSSGRPSFCPHCASILDFPETNDIICSLCDYRCGYQDLDSLSITSMSEATSAPKWLKKEREIHSVCGPSRATVEEACPTCNHPEMEYYTLQLRSADEGQTVFYECKNCGHKFSVNN